MTIFKSLACAGQVDFRIVLDRIGHALEELFGLFFEAVDLPIQLLPNLSNFLKALIFLSFYPLDGLAGQLLHLAIGLGVPPGINLVQELLERFGVVAQVTVLFAQVAH